MTLGQKQIRKQSYRGCLLSQRCTMVLFALFLFFSISSNAFSHEVIVNSSSDSNLSANTLRLIYSMRLQTWSDGSGITVFILDPQGDAHRKFCLEVLNVFPYQLQRVWDVLVFSGTGQAPIVVKNEQEMIAKVRSTPGAIGYVIKSEVPSDVKKLNIH